MIVADELQYLVDQGGEKTAVIVPIKAWNHLFEWYKTTTDFKEMQVGLKSAFEEVQAIESGERAKRSLDNLLEELSYED